MRIHCAGLSWDQGAALGAAADWPLLV